MPSATRLPRSFYRRDARVVARELLGKVLVHAAGGVRRAGLIVETEAYLGPADLASHAARGRTPRTEVMFGPPGHAYVYLIYGMHHCMNVVTGPAGEASAVLLRGLEPIRGVPPGVRCDGPGRLCRVLGISREHDRVDLCGRRLYVERAAPVPPRQIARGPRIGVDYAGSWARKPYRFWIAGHPCVSRARS